MAAFSHFHETSAVSKVSEASAGTPRMPLGPETKGWREMVLILELTAEGDRYRQQEERINSGESPSLVALFSPHALASALAPSAIYTLTQESFEKWKGCVNVTIFGQILCSC